ncbi:putative sugar phosphate class II aldolase [Oscillibacter valericigenes Sjm18-20]|nr:putative sugar phosphate class II aldolase [Oscillibacter valericigenes Sjm18-20]
MLLREERELVAEYGRKMSADRLSTGTSGNLSIYDPEHGLMAISPSGMGYFDIRPEDVVVTDLGARMVEGDRKPSSEWALHAAFYRRKPEARAVVHTHSVYCTTFAVLGKPIEAVHYAIADAHTDRVPCAPYETFGSPELARVAVDTCGTANAVLLANHGLVVCGDSMQSAYALASNMEFVAELQYRAMCVGKPNILSGAQMEEVLEKFRTYGQPK